MTFQPSERPRPPRHPDAAVTPAGRHAMETLRGIHHHLRREMAQVVWAVRAAATDARRARGNGVRSTRRLDP